MRDFAFASAYVRTRNRALWSYRCRFVQPKLCQRLNCRCPQNPTWGYAAAVVIGEREFAQTPLCLAATVSAGGAPSALRRLRHNQALTKDGLTATISACTYTWGISSAGRARGSQSRGQGFDPPMLHQEFYRSDIIPACFI